MGLSFKIVSIIIIIIIIIIIKKKRSNKVVYPIELYVLSILTIYFFLIVFVFLLLKKKIICELKHSTFLIIMQMCEIFFYFMSLYYIISSPLDQFNIQNLISIHAPLMSNLHISITNISIYLIIGAFILIGLNLLSMNNSKTLNNYWSLSQESLYATVNSIVVNQIDAKKGQRYFPFIYALFIFILVNNLVGMVPYSFASTSHFIVTFSISFTVVLGATILGFNLHGLRFFSLFVPSGCPLTLLPLLVLIEFISYLARNISLGLRLAANILSGHMLLNILAGFTYNIMSSGFFLFFFGLIPLAFIVAFSGLELGIAFVQAQVFVVLTSSYIKDALNLH